MKLLSVNVSQAKTVAYHGRQVATGIYKEPIAGRVRVGRLTIDGDRQVDFRVHGGADKAVYAYPHEHYATWQQELGGWLRYGMWLHSTRPRELSSRIRTASTS